MRDRVQGTRSLQLLSVSRRITSTPISKHWPKERPHTKIARCDSSSPGKPFHSTRPCSFPCPAPRLTRRSTFTSTLSCQRLQLAGRACPKPFAESAQTPRQMILDENTSRASRERSHAARCPARRSPMVPRGCQASNAVRLPAWAQIDNAETLLPNARRQEARRGPS